MSGEGALEVIKIAADRWVIYAEGHDEPLGVIDQLEALEPAGMSLFSAVLADGLEVGIYKSLAGALAALEAQR